MSKAFKQVLIVVLIAFVAFAAWKYSSGKGKEAQPPQGTTFASALANIEGYIIKPVSLDQSLPVSGTLIPSEETVIMPEVPGRIISLNLPEGQYVKKGTLLIKLYDGDLQAQLAKLQTQLQIAQTTETRQKKLLDVNGISQQDYDLSVLQVHNINADIDIVKTQISKTEIYAPYDGKIGLKKVSMGAYVTPGTALATLRSVQDLKLDFSVPEHYATEMKEGRKLKFRLEGKEQKYTATIFGSEVQVDAGTRNLNVRARVDNKDSELVPGKFALVDVDFETNANALMVPNQAIIPLARGKQVVVCKNGKAKMVNVETGVRRVTDIEVTKGLSVGDTVVVTGVLFVKPDMPLKFSKVSQ